MVAVGPFLIPMDNSHWCLSTSMTEIKSPIQSHKINQLALLNLVKLLEAIIVPIPTINLSVCDRSNLEVQQYKDQLQKNKSHHDN
jgi:hypothetical protein